MRAVWALGAVVLVAAGCGSPPAGREGGGPSSTSSTSSAIRTVGVHGPLTPDPSSSPATPVLVAGSEGIFSITPDGEVEELLRGPAAIAVDDTRGGILFQRTRGRSVEDGGSGAGVTSPAPEGSTSIWWIEGGSDEAENLVPASPGQFLQLHDAVEVEGEMAVFYTRADGSRPDDRRDILVRLGPSTGSRSDVREVGGWEWSSDPVSVTPSLIGLTESVEASRRFLFFTHDGEDVEVAGAPLDRPAIDCSSCPDLLELSPDGATLVYVEFGQDDRGFHVIPEVALADAQTGEELVRLRLDRPDQGWVPASLDLGDGVVLVNRWRTGEEGSAPDRSWVVDLREKNPRIWESPIAGHARLLRSVPQIEGVVVR